MNFETCLPFILQSEGGYVNDPKDAGGATNKGITQRTYDEFCVSQGIERRDVRLITDAQVAFIYKRSYWTVPGCDKLESGLDMVHFDACVNHGPGRAAGMLMRVQGMDVSNKASAYIELRREYYRDLAKTKPTQQRFLAGWLNRMDALEKFVAKQ